MSAFLLSDADMDHCLAHGTRLRRDGHQASIYVAQIRDRRILVKAAPEKGIKAILCRYLLKREYRVYRALKGVAGIPECYGFYKKRLLAIEYIESQTMRQAVITDRARFFAELIAIIRSIHLLNVAHGDLKRKENILVVDGWRPVLVDFGVSVIRKNGFHPVNRFWHSFLQQQDLNAWIKHKSNGNPGSLPPQDARFYRPMRIEMMARRTKRTWREFRRGMKAILTNITAS